MNQSVRTTSAQLRSKLGEPDDMDVVNTGTTLMRYDLRWKCGCRADGTSGVFLCRPCSRHVGDLRFL
ncbi:MAG: hypothetical protein WCE44_05400 [Candidatus Velthaea sp.]|jgi:hypothetical protein